MKLLYLQDTNDETPGKSPDEDVCDCLVARLDCDPASWDPNPVCCGGTEGGRETGALETRDWTTQ